MTLAIDGKEVTVPSGTLIIRAAEQLGIEIPRFCDHPLCAGRRLPAVLRRDRGAAELATSCTTTVAAGMRVKTRASDHEVEDAQVANLEFLLLNHPLDCPICDRGGECPLQDQALAFGPGDSRFREAKRSSRSRSRSRRWSAWTGRVSSCAPAARGSATRSRGDRFIELFERGAGEQVGIAAGEDFRSPFSGNTVRSARWARSRPPVPVRRPAVRPLVRGLGLSALLRGLQPPAGPASR